MQQLHCYLQHPLTSVVAMTTMQTGRLDTDADGQWARKKTVTTFGIIAQNNNGIQ